MTVCYKPDKNSDQIIEDSDVKESIILHKKARAASQRLSKFRKATKKTGNPYDLELQVQITRRNANEAVNNIRSKFKVI